MKRNSWFLVGGLLVALLLAGVVSNFASGAPDGLDSVSTKGCTTNDQGEITGGSCMARKAKDHEVGGLFANYGIRGVDNGYLSTGLAGVAGVLLTFAVGYGLFWLARRRPADGDRPADPVGSPADQGGRPPDPAQHPASRGARPGDED